MTETGMIYDAGALIFNAWQQTDGKIAVYSTMGYVESLVPLKYLS